MPPTGYPQINGKPCGSDWTVPVKITGLLPGTGFGSQFAQTLQPLTNNWPLIANIGGDERDQEIYADKIRERVAWVREKVHAPLFGDPLGFTDKQKKSIEWLLDRSLAELDVAQLIWDTWATREGGLWPLNMGDTLSTFPDCIGRQPGEWIEVGARKTEFRCPTTYELNQRETDRRTIGERFNDALANLFCAEYGYWKLRLNLQAYEAYKKTPAGATGGFRATPEGPGRPLGPMVLTGKPPPDPCKEWGIGCEPGEEPDDCPSGWCPDPDDLPPPDAPGGPLGMPTAPEVAEPMWIRPEYVIGAAAGVLVVSGIVAATMGR